jgi:hypothetical protein
VAFFGEGEREGEEEEGRRLGEREGEEEEEREVGEREGEEERGRRLGEREGERESALLLLAKIKIFVISFNCSETNSSFKIHSLHVCLSINEIFSYLESK